MAAVRMAARRGMMIPPSVPVGQTSRSTVGVAVIAPQHHWLLGPDPPSTSVHSPAIHLMTLGVNIAAICRLEALTALVLNDHAYDKLILKEECYGARSTPHR